MRRRLLRFLGLPGLLLAGLLPVSAAAASENTVVVLKGGTRIELKRPWVQQGNNALLTRSDGTLLSVPISEIDLKATAAAKRPPAPDPAVAPVPQTPAEALRSSREGPKAKVRLTDADVSHETVQAQEAAASQSAGGTGKADTAGKGTARLDVAGYEQSKSGTNLLVRGSVRNVGGTAASSSRMTVTALADNGDVAGTGEASLSKGTLDPFETVSFTCTVPVGDRIVAALRFSPQWLSAPPPATAAEIAAAAAAPAARPGGGATAGTQASGNQPPPPVPTPYGRGVLYANPAASAPSTPPADGRTGYIPGASDPASQPKPPDQ